MSSLTHGKIADLAAEIADLARQRPALAASAHQTELTVRAAIADLDAARQQYDLCVRRARDARCWANRAADLLRALDAALAEARADRAALCPPAPAGLDERKEPHP